MEIGYIFAVIRRYWWITAVLALLGLAAGYTLASPGVAKYESSALVVLPEPTSGSPERQIASQLVVLGSQVVREGAAERVGLDPDDPLLTDAVSVGVLTGTNVVQVTALTTSPQLSADLANAVVDEYQELLSANAATVSETEREALDTEIDVLGRSLADLDARIAEVLAPFLTSESLTIPTIEQVAPDLSSQRSVVLDQYRNAVTARSELERRVDVASPNEVLQRAEPATAPNTGSRKLIAAAGLVAGALLGVAAAVVVARLSKRVLDISEVAAVLGTPAVARAPADSALVRSPVELSELRPESVRFLRELCVQAESLGAGANPTVIAVAGSQPEAGTADLASAMANWYASLGLDTVLLSSDGDRAEPRSLRQAGILPLDDEWRVGDDLESLQAERVANHLVHCSLSSLGAATSMRLGSLASTLERAGALGGIVVVDGGPLLGSSATLQLVQDAHSVVLVVPIRRQDAESLTTVGRMLDQVTHKLLPVAVQGRQQQRSRTRRRRSASVSSRDSSPASPSFPPPPGGEGSVTRGSSARNENGASGREPASRRTKQPTGPT